MNYEKMSKEELINYILQQNTLIQEITDQNNKKDEKIQRLEADKRDLQLQLNELIKKYQNKIAENARLHKSSFAPKSEKMTDNTVNITEVDEGKAKKERRTPSQVFVEELKTLVREEDKSVVDYDFEANSVDRNSVQPFGEDVTYKVEIEAVQFYVKEIHRPKYKDKSHIYQALNDDVFPHSPLTPSFAADLIEKKYALGVPLERYASYLEDWGLKVSQQTLCNYVSRAAMVLKPLYDRLTEELLDNSAHVIHCDETPLIVCQSEKSQSYMFVYTTSFWDNPVYIYAFEDGRSTKATKELLKEYHGYFVCDGYPGYDGLADQGIKIQRCFVHVRRYFNDVIKTLAKELQKESPAYPVLLKIGEIFHKEREFREKKYTAEQIHDARNKDNYLKLINELEDLITNIDADGNEALSRAVNYYNGQKAELYTYLNDGHVDLSNNIAERAVRPFTIARKNFVTCQTVKGGIDTGIVFSIVQTAKSNGLKSESYIKYVLENINKKTVEELLPWSDTLPADLKIQL